MTQPESEIRMRYPIHAILLVGLCWLFYGVVLLASSVLILPCVPLAPALVMVMIGLGGLLSSVHEYARSVATPARTTTLPARTHGKASEAHGAPQHG